MIDDNESENELWKACPYCGCSPSIWTLEDVEFGGCVNTNCSNYDAPAMNKASWNHRPEEDKLNKKIDELTFRVCYLIDVITKDMSSEEIVIMREALALGERMEWLKSNEKAVNDMSLLERKKIMKEISEKLMSIVGDTVAFYVKDI